MIPWVAVYVAITKVIILATGSIILYYTARAATHTDDDGLWFLSLGIFMTGIALLTAGWVPTILGIDQTGGSAITGTIAAVGLVAIVYSMFADATLPS